jgi:hypothetical protein
MLHPLRLVFSPSGPACFSATWLSPIVSAPLEPAFPWYFSLLLVDVSQNISNVKPWFSRKSVACIIVKSPPPPKIVSAIIGSLPGGTKCQNTQSHRWRFS